MTKAGDRLLSTPVQKTTAYVVVFIDSDDQLRAAGSVLGRLFYSERLAEEALPRFYAAYPDIPHDEFVILPLEYGP